MLATRLVGVVVGTTLEPDPELAEIDATQDIVEGKINALIRISHGWAGPPTDIRVRGWTNS